MIGRTLGKYIFTHYIKICIIITVIISVLCVLIDFTQSSAHLSSLPHYKNIYAFIISTLRLPFLLLQILPFIALLDSLIFFFLQNKYCELVILRSIGISAWQFIFPVCLGSFFLGVIAIFIINPLSAYSLNTANMLITKWQGNNINYNNLLTPHPWIIQKTKDGETELHPQSIFKNIKSSQLINELNQMNILNSLPLNITKNKQDYLALRNTNFIFIEKDKEKVPTIKWLFATKTFLLPGYWLLIKPQIYSNNLLPSNPSFYLLKTNIQPQFVEAYLTDPNMVPFYKLLQNIKIAKNFGYNPYGFSVILHYLLALPMLLTSMSLIAAINSLRFNRDNNVKIYIMFAILAGFTLYLITNITQNFAKVGFISPIIAAWAPVLIALCAGISFLLKQEDG